MFRRKLSEKFINQLVELYKDQTSWWYKLVTDRQVFVAVRNGAINAYAGGASLARITYNSRGLRLAVHRKYLVLPDVATIESPYINLLGVRYPIEPIVVDNSDKYVKHLKEIIAAAERLTAKERIGEITIARHCKCVLDAEATFSGTDAIDDEGGKPGGRIDIVALNPKGKLILTEAKLYSNSEIRSKPNQDPDVCKQLIEYHEWARDNRKDIVEAYAEVQNYRKRLNLRHCEDGVARDLDVIPRLLIFGFDKAHRVALTDVKERVVTELRGRIPNFDKRHIQAVGSASSVQDHHLDGRLSPGAAA